MVKVFTPNEHGKIEFTKDELERLLNEVWQDGYSYRPPTWYYSPTWSNRTGITSNGGAPTITYDTSANVEVQNGD